MCVCVSGGGGGGNYTTVKVCYANVSTLNKNQYIAVYKLATCIRYKLNFNKTSSLETPYSIKLCVKEVLRCGNEVKGCRELLPRQHDLYR